MSTTTNNNAAIIPKWDGTKETAEMFLMKFQAACTITTVDGESCDVALLETFENALPDEEHKTLDESDTNQKKQAIAVQKNKKVMAMLMMAMSTSAAMCIVMHEMKADEKYPSGRA